MWTVLKKAMRLLVRDGSVLGDVAIRPQLILWGFRYILHEILKAIVHFAWKVLL